MWNQIGAPQTLTASAGPGSRTISLAWSAPADIGTGSAAAYEIHRSHQTGGPYAYVGTTASTTYLDSNLYSQPYYYVVKAINGQGTGSASNQANASPAGAPSSPNDGFDPSKYVPEALTGNTPFGGAALKSPCACQGAPNSVHLPMGEFVADFPLLHIENDRGSDFEFTLNHRTIANPDGNKSLAWGWDASWFRSLEADGSNYLYHSGNGHALTFTPLSGGQYAGPAGSYAKLVPVSGGFELHDRAGTIGVFSASESYRLTKTLDEAGNEWSLQYHSDGSLYRIVDPHNRIITLSYLSGDKVASNPFFDLHGRPLLESITDFSGRRAEIGYDHATGNIKTITTTGSAFGEPFETRFGYDDFGIIKIWDNEGQEYLRNHFDRHGRVVEQELLDGVGTTQYLRFDYDYNGRTTVTTDANGNEVEWDFDHSGTRRIVPSARTEFTRNLRESGFEDPVQYVTEYAYNAQDEVTKVTFPKGNSVSYGYDSTTDIFAKGNLRTVVQDPGPVRALRDDGSYQPQIEIEYVYDSAYNVVTKIIESRGKDATYEPQNGGNQSAARYTTRIFYDFEETSSLDYNGDGVTNSTDRRPVKIVYPTIHPTGSSIHTAFSSAYSGQARAEYFEWNSAGQLVAHVDAEGNRENRTYFAASGAHSNPFDREGYLASVVVDPEGLALASSFEYSPYGAIMGITDPKGNERLFELDARGRIIQETGPGSTAYRTKWAYNNNDELVQLERETDASTDTYSTREYAYDGLGRLVEEKVHATRSSFIVGALTGHPTPTSDTFSIHYAYDGNGQLIQRVNGAGDEETWTYDERGLLLSQSVGEGNGTYTYDGNGNLLAHQDPTGSVTWFQHDGFDRPAARVDSLGMLSMTHYDPAGNIVRERGYAPALFSGSPSGRPSSLDFDRFDQSATSLQYDRLYRYDEANQGYRADERHFFYQSGHTRASTVNTLSPSDEWDTSLREYDGIGQVVRTVNDNKHATTHEYDAAQRLKKSTDVLSNSIKFNYDKNSNVLSVTEVEQLASGSPAVAYVTGYSYDEENRLTKITNPDTTEKSFNYDGRDNLVKTIDELGNVVHTYFDYADRPWVVARELRVGGTGAGNITNLIETVTLWDGAHRPQHQCDGNGECTSYDYAGASGLLRKETHPDGIVVQHRYDADGSRIQTTFNNGKQLAMSYDELERLVRLDVDVDQAIIGTTQQTFAYDPMGRLVRTTDNGILNAGILSRSNAITTTQEYDSLGMLVGESQKGQNISHVRDGVGSIIKSIYPNGRAIFRTYDNLERLNHVWDSKGFIADHAYDGGHLVEKSFGSSTVPVLTSSYEFDDMRRITQLEHSKSGGSLFAGQKVRFNDAGAPTALEFLPNSVSGLDQLLGLDSGYRTTSWKSGNLNAGTTSISGGTSHSWGLDAANNWNSFNTGSSCSRKHGSGNQILTQTCGGTTASFNHDLNGNIILDDEFQYYYDFLNRLVRVDNKISGEPVMAFGYDALGRRVLKVVAEDLEALSPGGVEVGVDTFFTFSGQHVIQESQPFEPGYFPSLAAFAPVRVIRQWTHGSAVDEVLSMTLDENDGVLDSSDRRFFYLYDALGSVQGLVDESGKLVEGYSYDAYGRPMVRTPGTSGGVLWTSADTVTVGGAGSLDNPFLFTGRYWDSEISKYHYRARTYDPELGRFMSRDPIGNWGDSGNLGNGYAYVGNSPWQYTDPYGLCPSCIGAVVGAAVGALWQFGSYSYRVASTDATWDNQALSDDLKFGLIAGAVIGATGGLGAGVTGTVAAGGASAGAVFGTTVAVGAAEGIVGQATFDYLNDGAINDGLQAYAGAAAFGAVTAGAGYGVGALWKAKGGARLANLKTVDSFETSDNLIKVGGRSFQLTGHASERMIERGISRDSLVEVLNNQPFVYKHGGTTKYGYFDPSTNIFAATADGKIATVIQGARVRPYVENLGWTPWK